VKLVSKAEACRYPVAALAGLALGLAFPLPGWSGLAWCAPGILFFSILGLRGAPAFRVGYLAGLVHFLVMLRWLLAIPFPVGAVAGWLALSAYCALYFGGWAAGIALLISSAAPKNETGTEPARPAGPISLWGNMLARLPSAMAQPAWMKWESPGFERGGWPAAAANYCQIIWTRRNAVVAGAAALWTGLEWLRGWFLSGFPWGFLGVTQWRQTPLTQIASATGIYGVSFLVCWCGIAFASSAILVAFQPRNRWGWMSDARLPLLVLLGLMAWGFWRIVGIHQEDFGDPAGKLSMALVQPSVPETLLWDQNLAQENFKKIARLSEQALAIRPDVLVWPEGGYGMDRANFEAMTNLLAKSGAWWVLNGIDTDHPPDSDERDFNSNFLVDPNGRAVSVYHKRRLVIFGEYVPLERWLPFLHWLTPIPASFTAGEKLVFFKIGSKSIEAGPVICFEDMFPNDTREHVRQDTDLLLELTNDGWFGNGSAQWQHAANTAFRAIENGVPLVRCTNNGLTCWFDRCGVVHDILGQRDGTFYSAGWETVGIPYGQKGPETLYHRRGDWFAGVCGIFAAWGLIRAKFAIKRSSPDTVASDGI
jgi:apolipoprotein N-acyltransferase